MKDLLRAFLAYLRLNRNASAHTVRAYEGDLVAVHDVSSRPSLKRPRPELQPADITRPMIRGFLADLFRRGESRASAARKLAAVRTFLRYLKREGLIEADPGLLVVTPKREQKIPRHLEVDEMARLLETPDTSGAARPARSRDSRAALRVGPPPERTRGARPRGRESRQPDGSRDGQGAEGAARALQPQRDGRAAGLAARS